MAINGLTQEPNNPEGFKVIHCKWESFSIYPIKSLYATLAIKTTLTKKNGKESVPRNERLNFFFTFCPFCGQKYESESNHLSH